MKEEVFWVADWRCSLLSKGQFSIKQLQNCTKCISYTPPGLAYRLWLGKSVFTFHPLTGTVVGVPFTQSSQALPFLCFLVGLVGLVCYLANFSSGSLICSCPPGKIPCRTVFEMVCQIMWSYMESFHRFTRALAFQQ